MAWLPNLLTFLRILLTPLIVWDVLDGACQLALPLSLFAGLTDAADGYLARRFGWSSRTGAYLDPIADKLLLTGLYISFGAGGLVPRSLSLLVVGRDVLILLLVAGAFALTSIRDFPPSVWGKLSTAVQITGALVLLASCDGLAVFDRAVPYTIVAVGAVTVWSGLHYLWRAYNMLRST